MEKGRGAECSIIVTQPRRISAMSVSNPLSCCYGVSAESMLWTLLVVLDPVI